MCFSFNAYFQHVSDLHGGMLFFVVKSISMVHHHTASCCYTCNIHSQCSYHHTSSTDKDQMRTYPICSAKLKHLQMLFCVHFCIDCALINKKTPNKTTQKSFIITWHAKINLAFHHHSILLLVN